MNLTMAERFLKEQKKKIEFEIQNQYLKRPNVLKKYLANIECKQTFKELISVKQEQLIE